MKIAVNYFNFVFHIEIKQNLTISFEFRFSKQQKHEMALCLHELWCRGILRMF